MTEDKAKKDTEAVKAAAALLAYGDSDPRRLRAAQDGKGAGKAAKGGKGKLSEGSCQEWIFAARNLMPIYH